MTEAEWLTCGNPGRMLYILAPSTATERKLRLLAVGCIARVERLAADPNLSTVLEAAERYADGAASRATFLSAAAAVSGWELTDSEPQARDRLGSERWAVQLWAAAFHNKDAYWGVTQHCTGAIARRGLEDHALAQTHADLVRDLFGNPFRRALLPPIWKIQLAVAIAESVHEERNFGLMPVLADALEDAGCSDPIVLDHCRGPGPHARGCWMLDLLLRKAP
jgi:hypothetical protein